MTGKTKVTTPTDREIVITRIFDAPRELVFRTMLDPALVPRWWGPARLKTKVEKMDVRPGGAWRYIQWEPDGTEYGFHGEYREIVPPEKAVQTFEFEGMPGHVSVDTATYEDTGDGRTKFTAASRFDTKEDRDGMLGSGMEEGVSETYDRLEALLAERQKAKKGKKR
jgi:uncharacterized protein YndB with AHSA1/START domain